MCTPPQRDTSMTTMQQQQQLQQQQLYQQQVQLQEYQLYQMRLQQQQQQHQHQQFAASPPPSSSSSGAPAAHARAPHHQDLPPSSSELAHLYASSAHMHPHSPMLSSTLPASIRNGNASTATTATSASTSPAHPMYTSDYTTMHQSPTRSPVNRSYYPPHSPANGIVSPDGSGLGSVSPVRGLSGGASGSGSVSSSSSMGDMSNHMSMMMMMNIPDSSLDGFHEGAPTAYTRHDVSGDLRMNDDSASIRSSSHSLLPLPGDGVDVDDRYHAIVDEAQLNAIKSWQLRVNICIALHLVTAVCLIKSEYWPSTIIGIGILIAFRVFAHVAHLRRKNFVFLFLLVVLLNLFRDVIILGLYLKDLDDGTWGLILLGLIWFDAVVVTPCTFYTSFYLWRSTSVTALTF